ncbi:unnamed protein product [Gadus morhua 'NCC']
MSPILPTYHIAGTTAGRRTAGSRLSQTPCPVDDMAPSFAVCSERERRGHRTQRFSLPHGQKEQAFGAPSAMLRQMYRVQPHNGGPMPITLICATAALQCSASGLCG